MALMLGLLGGIVHSCVKARHPDGERTTGIESSLLLHCFEHRSRRMVFPFPLMLADIANLATGSSLEIHFSLFVTRSYDPETVPFIQDCNIKLE